MALLSSRPQLFFKAVRCSHMRAVVQDAFGAAETLRVSPEAAVPQARRGEVQVQVAYAALNRADLLQRMGRYPAPPGESPTLGLEASGVVASVGAGVTSLSVGDRVAALLGGGGYAEFATVAESHAFRLPAALSLRAGASLPECWLTAYQLLFFVGELRPGDRVLVHAAAGGVGSAATQLAKAAGARVFGVAGSDAKCRASVAAGAEFCFNYRAADFCQQLLRVVDGVDVVLDCVGASHLQSNLRCLATDARWVLYGLLGGGSLQGDGFLRQLLSKRASLRATLLRNRSSEYKAKLVSEFSSRMLPLFESGQLRPVIHSEFPLEQVAAAHKLMESNANVGKILLAVNPSLETDGKTEL